MKETARSLFLHHVSSAEKKIIHSAPRFDNLSFISPPPSLRHLIKINISFSFRSALLSKLSPYPVLLSNLKIFDMLFQKSCMHVTLLVGRSVGWSIHSLVRHALHFCVFLSILSIVMMVQECSQTFFACFASFCKFFYKNHVYKNVEAQIYLKFKNVVVILLVAISISF